MAHSKTRPAHMIEFFLTNSRALLQPSPGHEPEKSLLRGLRFFCVFEKSGINEATDLAVSQLRGSTIAIISAHLPGQHMWASTSPGPSLGRPGTEFKFSKTVQVGWSCQDLQLCQREIASDEIQEKRNYRECSNIKERASVPRKMGHIMGEALQRVSVPYGNRTHVARHPATHLNH